MSLGLILMALQSPDVKFSNSEVLKFIVKLHSELANPTELKLDGIGVDFGSPRHN